MCLNRHNRFLGWKSVWVVALAIMMVSNSNLIGAGSIFDDDFQPLPAQPKVPQPPPEPAGAQPPSQPIPAAPVPTPATDPAAPAEAPPIAPAPEPAPAEVAKREIPSKSDRDKSRSLLKDVYGQELADRSPPARKALADKFLQDAAKSSNAPADEFVLLGGAMQVAQEAADLPLSFQAADAMGKDFPIDVAGLKAQALVKMSAREFARNREENQHVAIALMDELENAGDYARAERVGTSLQQDLAGEDRTAIQQRVKSIHDKQVALSRLNAALAVLKKTPDDPAANLEAGRYFCLVKGDWTRGLPMLAKGSDAAVKALAAKELAAAKTAGGAELGDAWWEAADREPTALWKSPMHERAVFWYRQALNDAKGLARVKIEKRIQSLPVQADPALEEKSVLAELVAESPGAAQSAAKAKLMRVHNGTELKGGARQKVPGSFSDSVSVIDGRKMTQMISGTEQLGAGEYMIVYRVQSDVAMNAPEAQALDCILEISENGRGAGGVLPRMQAGKWSSISILLRPQQNETVQYRVRSYNNHAVAVDRIYVFKISN